MKKYELVKELPCVFIDPITGANHTLYPIVACMDFKVNAGFEVSKGQLGGMVEKPENLAQDGLCWIGVGAAALGNARIIENALLLGKHCFAYGNAKIGGQAIVSEGCQICGNAVIDGKVRIAEGCRVSENAHISDEAHLDFKTYVGGNAMITGSAHCTGSATIDGHAVISGHALVQGGHITGWAMVTGYANVRNGLVGDNAKVTGKAFVDNCWIVGKAHVGGIAVFALYLKVTEGMYLQGVHYKKKGMDALRLQLAVAFGENEKIYRFLMGKVRGLSRHYLVVPTYPARSAVPSNG